MENKPSIGIETFTLTPKGDIKESSDNKDNCKCSECKCGKYNKK